MKKKRLNLKLIAKEIIFVVLKSLILIHMSAKSLEKSK